MKLCNNRFIANSWPCFLLFIHLLGSIMELFTSEAKHVAVLLQLVRSFGFYIDIFAVLTERCFTSVFVAATLSNFIGTKTNLFTVLVLKLPCRCSFPSWLWTILDDSALCTYYIILPANQEAFYWFLLVRWVLFLLCPTVWVHKVQVVIFTVLVLTQWRLK